MRTILPIYGSCQRLQATTQLALSRIACACVDEVAREINAIVDELRAWRDAKEASN